MIKNYLLLLVFFFFSSSLSAQIISIPDANFKVKLLEADITNGIAKDKNQNAIKIDLNGDGEIQISEALQVCHLDISACNISSLTGITNFINLETLFCQINEIISLDVSGMLNLKSLLCFQNQISSLNLAGSINLIELYCGFNKLTNLNLSGLSSIIDLSCHNNQLTDLDLTDLINLQKLDFTNNKLTDLDLSKQSPDIFTDLSFYGNNLSSLDVVKFTNLRVLYCGNNNLTSLNISAFSTLETLVYSGNKIPNFDVKRFTNLNLLGCENTETTVLDLQGLVKLEQLYCNNNKLTSLDLKESLNLMFLSCYKNSLTTLDVTNLSRLYYLYCGENNFLTSINLKNSIDLVTINFSQTSVKSIDLSQAHALKDVEIFENSLLESIFIKNGSIEDNFFIEGNEKLKYLCVDDDQISEVENILKNANYKDYNVNSYCSFVPEGESFTIQGNNRNDSDNNGCNTNDLPASFLKFEISDGVKTGRLITNETGNYVIKVPAGSYTITPVFENPDYFSVFPASLQVEFPTVTSPVLQDFCITPVNSHKDLEVILLPITVARPGFTANYKIIFKNKGNVAQSGNVNLLFKDSVLDLMNATPAVFSESSNNLSWNFTNLKPFETREIEISFKVNSPIETPAVLNGDILNYTAAISSSQTDEKPFDNTFVLNQIVVGSYDPNDKTCLEGSVITPELIGEYVHYLIRFENTGNYIAENIVVKDRIDLSKFDISTLVPTSSSHSYTTKISDGNKVEFIFEKVNLPFDDANNDGYIAFKIKTLPTLKVGDTFANDANIYFDYNFPILTNKATSTFKTLGTQDFEFSSYFNVYPNPAKATLNISSKNKIEMQSMSIYDILGQLIIAVPNVNNVSSIDVSKLRTGNYLLKIKTEKGISGTKFIKE